MIENFLRRPGAPAEWLADLVRLLGVASVVVAGIGWELTDAGIVAFALPALVLPRFLGVRAWFDILFGVTVLVAAWSNVLDLYRSVLGWDLVVHFACTGVLAVAVYLLFAHLRIVPVPARPGARRRIPLVLTPTIGLAISALWELVEWFGHAFISDAIFVAYDDTIGDMTLGALGAVAGGILVALAPLLRPDARQP